MPNQRRWKVAHGSVTGTRHRQSDQECQDHSCFLWMPRITPDTIVAAVADGLGSASHGGTGAKTAAEAAGTAAAKLLWKHRSNPPGPERMESVLNAAVLQARMALEEEAAARELALADMATTLLLLVHTGSLVATAQIGDGAAVVSSKPGCYRTLAKPQRGEYANETVALTSKRALQRCEISIARAGTPVREIALVTDGLLNISMDMATMEPHPPFFSRLGDWLRAHREPEHPNQQLERTLSSKFIAQRTDDDLTLLLAVRTDLP